MESNWRASKGVERSTCMKLTSCQHYRVTKANSQMTVSRMPIIKSTHSFSASGRKDGRTTSTQHRNAFHRNNCLDREQVEARSSGWKIISNCSINYISIGLPKHMSHRGDDRVTKTERIPNVVSVKLEYSYWMHCELRHELQPIWCSMSCIHALSLMQFQYSNLNRLSHRHGPRPRSLTISRKFFFSFREAL